MERRLACASAVMALPLLAAGAGELPAARRLGWGSFTAESSNPTLQTSMGFPLMNQAMQGGQQGSLPLLTPQQEEQAGEISSEFISAMVQSFLHKQQLQPGELDCIVNGSKQVGGNVGKVAEQIGMILQMVFDTDIPGVPDVQTGGAVAGPAGPRLNDGASSIEDMVNQISSQGSSRAAVPLLAAAGPSGSMDPNVAFGSRSAFWTTHPPTQAPADPALDFFYNNGRRLQMLPGFGPSSSGSSGSTGGAMGALPVVMELGYNMQQMVQETHVLVGQCVHSDARQAFQAAGQHMRDLSYMTGHFLANGADIVDEFADSVLAYEDHNATRFGSDVGVALRKVFLSSNANGSLPEGMPGDAELANVTAGMLRGFFGPGTSMNINFKEDPTNPANIDMHSCVQRNLRFFQQVWAATMYMYAQKAVGADALHPQDSEAGRVQFGTMLAFTMMELPGALEKCNISPEQKDMILDSIKAMGSGLHVKFGLPKQQLSKSDRMGHFAQTVKDWSEHNWYEFGHGLGNVMRESAVARFPQKYSIGSDGLLRRFDSRRALGGGVRAVLVVPPVLLFSAVVLVLLRSRGLAARSSWRSGSECASDVEEGSASDGSPIAVE